MTAAELSPEHYGLLVYWDVETDWGLRRESVVLDELRRWVYKGERRIEITDMTPNGPFAGSARFLAGDTVVTVGERVRKPRRKRWLKEPLQEWRDLESAEQEGQR